MKKILLIVSSVLGLMIISSCGKPAYVKVGNDFLNLGFGKGSAEAAMKFLSSDMSDSETEEFLEFVVELASELPVSSNGYDFTYRSGYEYDVMGDEYAVGFYSVNDDKKNIIAIDFCKDGEWVVDELELIGPEEILDDYFCTVDALKKAEESGDKDKINEAKKDLKDETAVVNSFKDFFTANQWEDFKNSKK